MIYEGVGPASHYERIYHVREQHTHQIGLRTVGFRETVERLRDLGEQPVLLGAVDVAFPPYHYQLFVSADLSVVVGCLGVDQQFEFTRERDTYRMAAEDGTGEFRVPRDQVPDGS